MLAVPLVVVLVVTALLAAFVGGAFVAKRRAQAAADLAALAGATSAQAGRNACLAARVVAQRNGADAASCSRTGEDVLVEVRLPTGDLFGYSLTVVGRARAGPAS